MLSFFLGLSGFFIVLLSIFLILVILMQRPSANSGLGAGLAGNVADAALGVESNTILTRWTIYGTITLFILGFLLYLGHLYQHEKQNAVIALPQLESLLTNKNTSDEILSEGSLTQANPTDKKE